MNKLYFAALTIIGIIVLFGCAQQPQGDTVIEKEKNTITQNQAEESYNVEIIDYPQTAETGKPFAVSWKVDSSSPKIIKHTAVHYGYISHPGEYSEDLTAPESGYPSLTTKFANVNSDIPNTFSSEITLSKAGKLYLRAHAIINDENYWTKEYTINVIEKTPQPAEKIVGGAATTIPKEKPAPEEKPKKDVTTYTPQPTPKLTKNFVVEGDDNGLYPSELSINKGDSVKINFIVRKKNTYYGGLDFRSSLFNTGTILPGEAKAVEFIADKSFTYTSYWPASSVEKADGNIVVI